MRLKKLELQGFKSFADKTEICFENGITAVVGPNGSGKSNIADAIRWVLGEQSARNLRGSKMGDVIFSGTQSRNPVGFCQVSLVFDNDDNWLDIEFAEVTISRRYYKSGESEYSINKKNCRLKDVLALFRDTGVGKEGYSIIGQGQITDILSSNSADRRTAFEAATGVLTYKTRKAEAEQRLSKTTENMVRLQDVLSEMGRNMESLEEQAGTAKEFITCRDRLAELETSQFYYKHINMQQKLGKAEQELEQIKLTMSEFDGMEKRTNEEKEFRQAEFERLSQQQNQLQTEYTALHEEILRQDSQRQLFEQKSQTNAEQQERISRENAERLSEIVATEDKKKAIAERMTKLKVQLAEIQKKEESISRALAENKKQHSQLQAQLEQLKQAKIDYLNSMSEAKVNTSRFATMLESIEQRLTAIAESKKQLTQKLEHMQQEKSGYDEKVDAFEQQLSGIRKQIEQAQASKQQGKEQRYGIQQSIRELEIELGGLQSKINLLTNLQSGYEGYFEAVKKLMKDPAQKSKVLGTVADVIQVPGKFVTAVETALGNALQNVITANENDAKELIGYLKQNRIGRATFLPLTAVEGRQLSGSEKSAIAGVSGVFGAANELVEHQAKFAPVVEKLLGRTVIVDNLDTAITIMRKTGYKFTSVTLDGDIMYAGGAMTGGSKNNKNAGLLSRGEELEQLKQQEKQTARQLEQQKQAIEDCQKQLTVWDQQIAAMEANIAAAQQTFQTDRDNQQTIGVQIENEQSKLTALSEEAEQLLDNKADIESQLQEKTGVEPVADVDEKQLAQLQEQVSGLSAEQEQLQAQLTELLMTKTGIEKDIAAMESDDGRYDRRIAKYRQEMEDAQAQAQTLAQQMDVLQEQFEGRSSETSTQQQQEQALKTRLAELENDKQACQIQSRDLDHQLEQMREQNKQTLDRRFDLQMNVEKLKMEASVMAQEIFEKYDLTLEQLEQQKETLLPEADVKGREVNSLKNKLRAMGNVNLNAIDDYAELKSRHTETSMQLSDLETSKKDLEDLIARLFATMTKQFNEKFQLINQNFSKIFQELFGGGTANLQLGEGNAMECDIEINAQPPGKKLQTISLLSGGEKALTAIAILFAMLELKPTPFCVLDEIEAALDEANVYGFAQYLANYAHDTQFIVITHRRGVMDSSNAIYGVAMQEKGISKVMSLKLEEKEA